MTVTRDGEFAVTGAINGRITIWRMFPLTKLYTYQVHLFAVLLEKTLFQIIAATEQCGSICSGCCFSSFYSWWSRLRSHSRVQCGFQSLALRIQTSLYTKQLSNETLATIAIASKITQIVSSVMLIFSKIVLNFNKSL